MKRKLAPGALGLLGLLLVLLLGSACTAPATPTSDEQQAPEGASKAVVPEGVAAIPAITVFKSPT